MWLRNERNGIGLLTIGEMELESNNTLGSSLESVAETRLGTDTPGSNPCEVVPGSTRS